MKKETFVLLENYMLSCMQDSAHDPAHIYRVLCHALAIADTEPETDRDVLVAACLLHDIGRREQLDHPALCHAMVGGEKAERFLRAQGFPAEFCVRVRGCIETHRFRSDNPPWTLEAKILFDADKLDVTGALGIARSLLYEGEVGDPLCHQQADGRILDGVDDQSPCFLREYERKLRGLYSGFYTACGAARAKARQAAAQAFYDALTQELRDTCPPREALIRASDTASCV